MLAIKKNPIDTGKAIAVTVVAGIAGFIAWKYWTRPVTSNVEFSLGQPTASPAVIKPGEVTVITVPVTSVSDKEVTVDIQVEIKQAGSLWMEGALIETKTVRATISPGQTYMAKVNHTGTAGGPANAQGISMRALGITTLINAQMVGKSWTGDNVFGVDTRSVVTGFQLLEPVCNPMSVVPGGVMAISCPVKSLSLQPHTLTMHVEIKTKSGLWTSGNVVAAFDSPPFQLAAQGEAKYDFSYQVPSNADIGKRVITVTLLENGLKTPSTGPKNPNEFDKGFDIVAPATRITLVSAATSTPRTAPVGGTVSLSIPIKSDSTQAVTISPRMRICEHGAVGPGDTIEEFASLPSITIQPGATQYLVKEIEVKGAVCGKDVLVWLFEGDKQLAYNRYANLFEATTGSSGGGGGGGGVDNTNYLIEAVNAVPYYISGGNYTNISFRIRSQSI
ncbi:MAG: hypothetical protein PHU70_02005, partial [Dehalococcoidia bacterium]|nr:hypothetical protein [Dehalococcoidia bacterium]